MSRFRAGAASALLAAALLGVAIGARSGAQLERTAIVEILVVAAGAAAICLAVLTAPARPGPGGPAALAFALLAGLTAISVEWSIAPDLSFEEAGRTLAYLAAFAGAVAAARLRPRAGPAVATAVLTAAVAVSALGLAARVWPGTFSEGLLTGRISFPFEYWNALAGVAAIGLVPALWLGTRRSGGALARALAYPAVGLLVATVLIAQSRGALLGAALACAIWIAVVPLRLRSLVVLAVGAAGAAPVSAWALSKEAFRGVEPLAAREAVAGDLGLLLLTTVAGLLLAGLALGALRERRAPSLRLRARTGLAVGALAVVASLALLGSVAASERGIGGTVSDRVEDLTDSDATPPEGGARLASTSSSRAGYWGTAIDAFEERPLAGLGAGSYELGRLRYRDPAAGGAHAHGYPFQTLADLGLLGLLAALAALVAWAAAAWRTLRRGWRGAEPWSAERGSLAALALAAVAYGVQSAIDWTWFVPGPTVMALVAAGFVAGRGSLAPAPAPDAASDPAPDARVDDSRHSPSEIVHSSAEGSARPGERFSGPRLGGRISPARLAVAAGVMAVAVLGALAIWRPVAAENSIARAYELLDADRPAAALAEAAGAYERFPESNEALYARATILADAGLHERAEAALRAAARARPRDPTPWLRLALLELDIRDAPVAALNAVERAARLDPLSGAVRALQARVHASLDAAG